MVEHDRLTASPVLVEDLRAVLSGDERHVVDSYQCRTPVRVPFGSAHWPPIGAKNVADHAPAGSSLDMVAQAGELVITPSGHVASTNRGASRRPAHTLTHNVDAERQRQQIQQPAPNEASALRPRAGVRGQCADRMIGTRSGFTERAWSRAIGRVSGRAEGGDALARRNRRSGCSSYCGHGRRSPDYRALLTAADCRIPARVCYVASARARDSSEPARPEAAGGVVGGRSADQTGAAPA